MMQDTLLAAQEFRVHVKGTPKPGGSKRAFLVRQKGTGRMVPVITDANPNAKEWKQELKYTIRQEYHGKPMEGPLKLVVEFVMPRLKSHLTSAGEVKPSAPYYHIVKPDGLKLRRLIEDAMTSIVYHDDAQICQGWEEKHYGETPGVTITVSRLTPGGDEA